MASILEDYINKGLGSIDLKNELKRLIKLYNQLTGRNLFIYASDFNKQKHGIDVSLMQDDFYTIQDILRESDKNTIDVYLETPGGSGETAEEIARFLHKKFNEVNFVIVGEAKSAGTILALSGDNLYMSDTGSLGPIDAQVKIGRSMVSAYDYKAWIDEKKEEAKKNGRLDAFDAIVVAQISPGEINGVVNSLKFAQDLVAGWLEQYKFKNWTETETTHTPVTAEMKRKRAEDVSESLCNHMNWRSHGRSLKREDLNSVLKIERVDDDPQLANILYRIKTCIRLIFDTSTDFKLYLWEDISLSKTANPLNPNIPMPNPIAKKELKFDGVEIGVVCPRCGKQHKVQGFFDISSEEIKKYHLPVDPKIKGDNMMVCDNPGCNFTIDLKPLLNQIENNTKRKVTLK
jgi:hypothetical protein